MNKQITVLAPVVAVAALMMVPPDSDSVTLYTSDALSQSTHNLNTISLADGSATLVGPFGVAPNMAGLAYDARNAILYGTTSVAGYLHSIDMSTGAATRIGALGVPLMHGLAFDNTTGTLYGTYGFSEGDGLYTIDTSNGVASLVGNIGFFFDDHRHAVSALSFHPETHVLYGAINGSISMSAIAS